jgi:hypothetical protein
MQNSKKRAPNRKLATPSNVHPNSQSPDDEYLSEHVERALLTVRRYLAPQQAQLVRKLVHDSLQTDPVSRQLFARAAAATKAMPGERRAPDAQAVSRRGRAARE